jgi:hypothetical protein
MYFALAQGGAALGTIIEAGFYYHFMHDLTWTLIATIITNIILGWVAITIVQDVID